jgi:putative redox protein
MVKGKKLNTLAAEIWAGQFQILAGVNEKLGGNNEGPSPHELLEAALTACTIITLQMYANRKQMKLTSAHVTVKIESESAETSVISRKIQLEGDLSSEERAKLLEIADKCPVHKLLSSKVTINSEIVI